MHLVPPLRQANSSQCAVNYMAPQTRIPMCQFRQKPRQTTWYREDRSVIYLHVSVAFSFDYGNNRVEEELQRCFKENWVDRGNSSWHKTSRRIWICSPHTYTHTHAQTYTRTHSHMCPKLWSLLSHPSGEKHWHEGTWVRHRISSVEWVGEWRLRSWHKLAS